MDTREELIEKINFSEEALKKMNSLESNIKKFEKQERRTKQERHDIEISGDAKSVFGVIISCVIGFLVGGFIGLIIAGTIFSKSAFWGDFSMFGGAAIGTVIPIIKQVKELNYEKNVLPQRLAEKDKLLEEIRTNIKEAESKAGEYVFSDEWNKAVGYIPRDYFYKSALEKMKYFLINGHADNLKEAVKLYDEYLHREKLEYEAKRAADEARRAADMSEMTAAAASEATEYAKIIKEQNESIEFWSKMNTFTSEEIYRKLN